MSDIPNPDSAVEADRSVEAAPAESVGIEAIKVDQEELLAEIDRLREENEKLVAARTSDSHLGVVIGTVCSSCSARSCSGWRSARSG